MHTIYFLLAGVQPTVHGSYQPSITGMQPTQPYTGTVLAASQALLCPIPYTAIVHQDGFPYCMHTAPVIPMHTVYRRNLLPGHPRAQ